ncbi:MAG: quinate 5-dehydrogenase [Actinomycetota bacterium]|nr:quinate 5-dehydrogenase [Actinomycetota bacterium]
MSISIGSSARDHEVELELLGERFLIRREGTDGDLDRAAARFAELDGRVDALGMGGIDRVLYATGWTFRFRDAKRLTRGVTKTPVLDGAGLKGVIEGSTVEYLARECGLPITGKHALVPSAVDRWGLTQALHDAGATLKCGDFQYAVDLPVFVTDWRAITFCIRAFTPLVVQLPFSLLYPTGSTQEREPERNPRIEAVYRWADIVAGDWLYVRKFMPAEMDGKLVITNTTTPADVEFLRERGVELLVTAMPRLDGRSFGANVIEAVLVALDGASGELSPERYRELLDAIGFAPQVTWLQRQVAAGGQSPSTNTPAENPADAPADAAAEPEPAAAVLGV